MVHDGNSEQDPMLPLDISKSLMEFSHFGYMWRELNSNKIIASHTIYTLLDIDPFSELLTVQKWREFVHPQDLSRLLQAEEKLLADQQSCAVEYRLITHTGRHIFINHSMHLSSSKGGQQKIVSILDDITEKKRADIILETMHESFFEMNKNFIFRRINKKTEFLWQVKREELIGKSIWDVFPQAVNTPFYDLFVKAMAATINTTQELVCPVTGGWLRISASPYADGLFVILYDIQKEKQAAEEIKALNQTLISKNKELRSANDELRTFTSIAANDYSETLRHLYINLELIVNNDARNLSNSGRANLRRAQAAIQKLKLATDDMVTFSRLQHIGVKEEKIDLDIILGRVLKEFESHPAYALITIRCGNMPIVSGYPFLLSLMFQHLIENAIKFRKTDQGHTIDITCRESVGSTDINHMDVQKDKKYHIISFVDNGIGFPAEEAEKIFGMFYRLNDKSYKGSGIGLAICKKIMYMHGGFIVAEGETGKGAAIHCYFPT